VQRDEPRRPIGLTDHRLIDRLPLRLVALEKRRAGDASYDETQFPSEIERILNAEILAIRALVAPCGTNPRPSSHQSSVGY